MPGQPATTRITEWKRNDGLLQDNTQILEALIWGSQIHASGHDCFGTRIEPMELTRNKHVWTMGSGLWTLGKWGKGAASRPSAPCD
jgi:hypothetical protein